MVVNLKDIYVYDSSQDNFFGWMEIFKTYGIHVHKV